MKVFVTGVNGQLGYDVMNELNKRGHIVLGSDLGMESSCDFPYISLDITDRDAVDNIISDFAPEAVIHCAAWTQVDAAEEEENYRKVYGVNVDGTKNIADVCKKLDAKMIYISTDYVFDGSGTDAREADDKNLNPINVYGKTKFLGECAVSDALEKFFIVRIAWVFGINGNNFVKTMLRIGKSHPTLRVVNDQIGTPTYTYHLSRLLVDMAESDKYGFYHATNEGGFISWYDFAKEIFSKAGYTTEVLPVTTEEYGVSKAARPKNSRLCKSKLIECGFSPLPHWKDALEHYLKELKEE